MDEMPNNADVNEREERARAAKETRGGVNGKGHYVSGFMAATTSAPYRL